MKRIQLDMYAVGLGAAVLTQLRLDDGSTVSILADGGMGHGGYPAEGVHDRLGDSFAAFGSGDLPARIDLMVGTHYDSDHLKGLVPIAQDDSIEIGEVWLPPVKDDTDEIPGHVSESDDFLAVRFYEDESGEELRRYLEVKRLQVEELRTTEDRVLGLLQEQDQSLQELPAYNSAAREWGYREFGREQPRPDTVGDYIEYFERQEQIASRIEGGELAHGSSRFDSSVKDLRDLARDVRERRGRDTWARIEKVEGYLKDDPETLRLMPGVLASIRKSTAAGAITASHLHKLVQALKARRRPLPPRCHYITAGEPVRFGWNPVKRRFVRGARMGASDPVLTLLGPSDVLVEKHREKLPVGSYLFALSMSRFPITLEGITESNQLSYIFTLETVGQRILISGDAGCYGFKDENGYYWPDLVEALRTLHVVQVAHHAGHNYDFYNTLLAAGFGQQEEFAYLLLSHGVRDAKRPSDAFAQFVAQARAGDDELGLLFTSEPLAVRVQDFDELILPVVPTGQVEEKGDVRLSFAGRDDTSGWTVDRHAVRV